MKTQLLLILLLISGCNLNKDQLVSPETYHYQTTQQSMLFFRNVRGMYYEADRESTPHMHLYRFKDRIQDSTQVVLNLLLVNHWRNEQAYVILEPSKKLNIRSPEKLTIQWQDTATKETGSYHFPPNGNRDAHYKMATQVYNSILQNHQLQLLTSDTIPMFTTKDEREAFRITMVDFYRIVKVF